MLFIHVNFIYFCVPNIYLVDAPSGKNNDTPIIIFVNLQRLYSQLAFDKPKCGKGRRQ